MERLLGPLVWLCCVWSVAKAIPRGAQIAASIMDTATGQTSNASYYLGIYGRSSLKARVSGKLVHVRSEGDVNLGCTDYNHDLPSQAWVALIERGQCYFSEKIHRATKLYNASAVIVYDNQPTKHYVSMQSFVTDEVYLYVKQDVGRRLALMADTVTQGYHVHVNITSAEGSSSAAMTASPALATVICLALMVVGLATVGRYSAC